MSLLATVDGRSSISHGLSSCGTPTISLLATVDGRSLFSRGLSSCRTPTMSLLATVDCRYTISQLLFKSSKLTNCERDRIYNERTSSY